MPRWQLGNVALLDEWLETEGREHRRQAVLNALADLIVDPLTAPFTPLDERQMARLITLGKTGVMIRCVVVEQYHVVQLHEILDAGAAREDT